MELKHVIPNMEKTFGNLEYAGEGKTEQRRVNGRMTVISRSFNLYSDVQRADDIIVVLPASAGEKNFEVEEKVKLINPKITADGYKIGTRGFTNYILSAVMPEVYYRKEEITDCIDRFYEGMMERSEAMKLMENYKTGENYAYLGLPPHFLIFDEYVAFMEMLTTKENALVLNKLKQIVMLGRQAGYFLILACQRPDAKYLGDGIRDQFNFRVALGRMSELGYSMMFGEVDKDFFLKQIKGRGYVDTGTSVISEFYTPLVPKGHDFLREIGRLMQNRQDGQAACEAKAAGSS